MIIVDSALARREAEGNPIRVAMVGAGFMGRGIALQLLTSAPGIRLVAISNRNVETARNAYALAGAENVEHVESPAALEAAISAGRYAVTEDAMLLAEADAVDALIEVTGTIELGARVTLSAIEHGKHVILMNAELDGTIGPILK
ncbi:MAG: hypothetical protein QOG29_1547, partial [Gaiellaceae bacterium]|nr:hypothetical protein [Gaiellaceae bacterium]